MSNISKANIQSFHADRLADDIVTFDNVVAFLRADVNRTDSDEFSYALFSGLIDIDHSRSSYHLTVRGAALAA